MSASPQDDNERLREEMRRARISTGANSSGNGQGNGQGLDAEEAEYRANQRLFTPGSAASFDTIAWEPDVDVTKHVPQCLAAFIEGSAKNKRVRNTAVAMSFIGVCAAAISDDIKIYVKDGWDEHCRHWTMLVGRSSTAKSPAMNEAMIPLQRIDNEVRKASGTAICNWAKLPKKPTGGGAGQQQTQQNTPRPIYCAVILNDASPESVGDIAPDNPRGLFYHADELMTLFGGMGRYSGSKGAEQGLYLAAFNGIPFTVDRIKRGHVSIPNLSIGMLGAITLDGVRKMVQENYETGMLARFIPVMMRPTQMPEVNIDLAAERRAYHQLVDALFSLVAPPSEPLGFKPQRFVLSPSAEEIRAKFFACNRACSEAVEEREPRIKSALDKLERIYMRLCLTFHCIEHCNGKVALGPTPPPQLEIPDTVVAMVDALMQEVIRPHVLAFWSEMLGISVDEDELKLVADYILVKGLKFVKPRDVVRADVLGKSRDTKSVLPLLEKLENASWLALVEGQSRSNASPRWVVNAEVHRDFALRAQEAAGKRQTLQAIFSALRRPTPRSTTTGGSTP